jgi:hypothetical protein
MTYTIIRNALTPQTCAMVKHAMTIMKDNQYFITRTPKDNHNAFVDGFPVTHDCWSIYSSTITESLLLTIQPLVEQQFDVKLFPTYSFCRIYWPGSDMVKHVDRPACEYSVSVCISTESDPWPIWFGGKEVILEAGDLVIYKGPEVEHWRNTYKGVEQFQAFLHYVDQNGPYANQKFDGRPLLGLAVPKR